jgi:hypothetical protein
MAQATNPEVTIAVHVGVGDAPPVQIAATGVVLDWRLALSADGRPVATIDSTNLTATINLITSAIQTALAEAASPTPTIPLTPAPES